ncbi:40S ribosomal protein s11-1-like, partial [Trifolium pratense]
TEKAFSKQQKVFLSSKKSGKGKRPGKGGNRFWKSVGLGFKPPRDAIEADSVVFFRLGRLELETDVVLMGQCPWELHMGSI